VKIKLYKVIKWGSLFYQQGLRQTTTNTTNIMETITTNGTLINGEGYIESHGVTVIDHGDTISIASSEYDKDELIFGADYIESKISGWKINLN
jgi:hypothetical protein